MSSLARRLDSDRRRPVMIQPRPLIATSLTCCWTWPIVTTATCHGYASVRRRWRSSWALAVSNVTRVLSELRECGLIETGYATTGTVAEQGLTAVMGPPPLP